MNQPTANKTSETPVTETPVPETPVPETPVPENQVPETPVPETPVPETPVPETPMTENQVPETPAPETPAPETPAPEAQMPKTSAPEMHTPLAAKAAITLAGTCLAELPLCGKIIIRGNSEAADFAAAVVAITGLTLPIKPNTYAQHGQSVLSWTGPNEWTLHCPLAATAGLLAQLNSALKDQHAAVIDLSDYYTLIELSGALARAVLASGSPFDTHPSQFKSGDCAQTGYGRAAVLINQMSDEPKYHIQVRWSHADYLFTYMHDALRNHAAGLKR